MSRIRSIRLAQFYRLRFAPAVPGVAHLSEGELFEAAGWLIEGVFCGFFDARDADLLWVRINPLMRDCGKPISPLVSDALSGEIRRLLAMDEPFRESLQMTEGPQKRFELPLFPYALLLANRMNEDHLARICTWSIHYLGDSQWNDLTQRASSASEAEVLHCLTNPDRPVVDGASLLSGYLRLLEHMDASRSFFEYAKLHSPRGSDFESYCQRIGGLNAWRIPVQEGSLARRLEDLKELAQSAIRPMIQNQFPNFGWPIFQDSFSQHTLSLLLAWETHHFSASLAGAF